MKGKTNRFFVRDAIKQTLEELSADQNLEDAQRDELAFDQDRQGVPGTPDLAAIILEKIDSCSVFVADVSIVGELSNGKSVINSNVAIELGYALKAKGNNRILLVANESFTSREKLPFDLRHKAGPIFFSLSDDASKSDMLGQKTSLINQLKEAIKLILKASPNQIAPPTHLPTPANENGMYFKMGDTLLQRGNQTEPWSVIVRQSKFFYVRVIPSTVHSELKRVDAKNLVASVGTMHPNSGAYNDLNQWGAISIDVDTRDNSPLAATQLFLNSEIWGFDCEYVDTLSKNGKNRGVPTGEHERMFLYAVKSYFALARHKLNIPLPLDIELGMVGGRGNYLFMSSAHWNEHWGPFNDSSLILRATVRTDEPEKRDGLCLEFFEKLFDSAGRSVPQITTIFQIGNDRRLYPTRRYAPPSLFLGGGVNSDSLVNQH